MIGTMVICTVFYLLCFFWLFYAYLAINMCYDTSNAIHSTDICKVLQHCTINSMPGMENMRQYFLFRMIIYGISPITVLATVFMSHIHQNHILSEMTGLPGDIYPDETKQSSWCSHCATMRTSFWLWVTGGLVLVVNVVLGIVTLIYDGAFLSHMTTLANSGDSMDKLCLDIVENNYINGTNLNPDPDNARPNIRNTPIPVIMFNLIYTIWGLLYMGRIVSRRKQHHKSKSHQSDDDFQISTQMNYLVNEMNERDFHRQNTANAPFIATDTIQPQTHTTPHERLHAIVHSGKAAKAAAADAVLHHHAHKLATEMVAAQATAAAPPHPAAAHP